jgi:hypothetical protein
MAMFVDLHKGMTQHKGDQSEMSVSSAPSSWREGLVGGQSSIDRRGLFICCYSIPHPATHLSFPQPVDPGRCLPPMAFILQSSSMRHRKRASYLSPRTQQAFGPTVLDRSRHRHAELHLLGCNAEIHVRSPPPKNQFDILTDEVSISQIGRGRRPDNRHVLLAHPKHGMQDLDGHTQLDRTRPRTALDHGRRHQPEVGFLSRSRGRQRRRVRVAWIGSA